MKTGITPLKPRTAQTDGYRDQYVLTPTLPNGKFPMLCDSGMEESRHPKIAELRKFMLHRPSKAVMAKIVEAFGALLAALTQPFVSHDVGYAQVVPGQKSRKVRNHMLKSPFKSMIARAATFALVLALGIAFVTVGLAPSASAQQANDDPCKADTNADPVTVSCSYDENDDAPVANFSGMDPEGEMIVWSLAGDDAADFDITGGVLSFSKSPNYESPADADTNNVYMVDVVATEVRAPGSLDLAQSTPIEVTVTVKNVDEDASLTLDRLQVRAPGVGDTPPGNPVSAVFSDPDTRAADGSTVPIMPGYTWYVPKVSRPDLENDDHWRMGLGIDSGNSYTPAAGEAGKHLRVVATYTDQAGDPDKAYARSVYPVGAARSIDDNNAPLFPDGTPTGFTVREDAAVGTVLGTVTGSDVDGIDVLTHALAEPAANNDDGLFRINPVTGQITVGDGLDFEDATDRDGGEEGTQYRITVSVYDSLAEDPPRRDIDITVTDVNDAPDNAEQGTTTVLEPHGRMRITLSRTDATVVRGTRSATVLRHVHGNGRQPMRTREITSAAITLSLGGTDGALFSLTDDCRRSRRRHEPTTTYIRTQFQEIPELRVPGRRGREQQVPRDGHYRRQRGRHQ